MKAFWMMLLFLPLLAGCPKQSEAIPEGLIGAWVHSHEEDTPEARVFRPHGYDFPPSRGREGFEVKANGVFIHYAIAPADGNISREGAWVMEGNTMKVSFSDGQPTEMQMEIMDVSKEMLKVRKQ